MKQKKVWLMSGIPGSGKSTYVKKKKKKNGGIHCSRDEVRFRLLKDNDNYFDRENEVFSTWIKEIVTAINSEHDDNIYIDATHLTEKARKKVLNLLPIEKIDLTYIAFDIPLEICLERNKQRTGRALVPETVIKNMLCSYTIPKGDNVIIIKE